MTREEAIKEAYGIPVTKAQHEALQILIPELAENDDERIRAYIILIVKDWWNKIAKVTDDGKWPTEEEMLAYLEKQKDVSKAIEAVEKIDKYIDEHLANAHDMKDSNPDKKYYRGWDDALGEMARILQDVYSDEKQKEQKPDIQLNPEEYINDMGGNGCYLKNTTQTSAWSEDVYSDEKQKEQNIYKSSKSEIDFADRYSKDVWEKLMSKFKAVEGYSIGCNDVSDIVLNAILNSFKWQKEQKESITNEWPNVSNCHKNCKKCMAKCLYRKEAYEEKKPAEKNAYPPTLDEAIKLYYNTYGNGKGGFDYLSLPKFQDIVKTFVYDYSLQPAEWSEEEQQTISFAVDWLTKMLERTDVPEAKRDIESVILGLKSLRSQPKQELRKEEIEHLYAIASFIKSKGYEDNGEFLEGVADKLKMTRKETE